MLSNYDLAAEMGAGESKAGHGASDGPATDALDYYQLLDVDENATADEIKVGDFVLCHRLRALKSLAEILQKTCTYSSP